MADEKRGLPRPRAPVDLFTLQPEPELVAETAQAEATAPVKAARPPAARTGARQQSRREKAGKLAAVPRAARIKTSVELLPETLELIDQVKAQYRREFRRHLPVWKLLDEAVRELATKRLK